MRFTNIFILRKICDIKFQSSIRHVSLVKKSWSAAHEIDIHDLTSILHTATEFRNSVIKPEGKGIKIPDMHNKNMTLLLKSSTDNEMLQAPFYSAGQFLQAPVHTIILPTWDSRHHVLDMRKLLEKHTDCLFCESQYVSKSHKIIYDSPIPIVFVRGYRNRILLGLAQLMTIYVKFGRLKGLNVMWIGPPCAILNTMLTFASMLCINFNYCCGFNTSAPASPSSLEIIKRQCAIKSQSFNCHECTTSNLKVIAEDADVILTTEQEDSSLNIMKEAIKTLKPQCILLHTLQRGPSDIDEYIFRHENCLVWEMVANLKWIYAALMVRLTSEYEHISPEPIIDCRPEDDNCKISKPEAK